MPNARAIVSALLAYGALALAEPPAVYVEVPVEDRIEVEWSGCASELEGPVCRVRPGARMVLWVAPGQVEEALTVRLGNTPLVAEMFLVQLGEQIRVFLPDPLPEPLPPLALRAGDSARWRIPLSPEPTFERLERVRDARNRRGSRHALDLINQFEVDQRPLDAEEQAGMRSLRGRLLADEEAIEEGAALLVDNARDWRSLGVVSALLYDPMAASFFLKEVPEQLQRRAQLLDELGLVEATGGMSPEVRARMTYHRAILDGELENYRAVQLGIQDAFDRAERLDLHPDMEDAMTVLAREYARLGRAAEGRELLLSIEAQPDLDRCVRARVMSVRRWIELEAEAEAAEHWDPLATSHAVLALDDERCRKKFERLDSLIDTALAELREGRLSEAAGALQRARALMDGAPPESQRWFLEAEARLALAGGRPRLARDRFDRLYELSVAHSSLAGAWRASVGRAEVSRSLGDLADMVRHLEIAEDLLDRELAFVPVGEGRDSFTSGRSRATSLLVEAYLAFGNPDRALAAHRRARTRALRSLRRTERTSTDLDSGSRSQRAVLHREFRAAGERVIELTARRWDTPADQLPDLESEIASAERDARRALDGLHGAPTQPDGLSLTDYPPDWLILALARVGDRWVALIQTDGNTIAEPLAESVHDSIAPLSQALERFVDRVATVVVLAAGEWEAVDLHALEVEGAPLLAHTPVVYGADVGIGATRLTRHSAAPIEAVVVADPNGDLAGARAEADPLAHALAAHYRTRAFVGSAATRGALLDVLSHADLLYFAGHSEAGGPSGWQRVLRLKGAGTLSPADVIVSTRVPSLVILSGCGTAAGTRSLEVAGLGIARAFVLAGAETVVATARPVSDAVAASLSAALTSQTETGLLTPERIRRAMLALRRDHPAEWSSYRLVTR